MKYEQLKNICTTTQGIQLEKSEQIDKLKEGYIKYLYIADFKNNSDEKYVKDIYPEKIVSESDLVMANTGSPGVVFKGKYGVLSNNLFKITFDNDAFNRDFLYYYLTSKKFQSILQSKMKGGVQKHLGHKTIGDQLVPLINIKEQKKIVEVLDKAQDLIDKRKAQIEALDELVKSRFIEMFGNPAVNPMRWPEGTVRDIVTEVKYGTSKPAVVGGKYKYLRMNNITYNGKLDISDLKYIDIPEKDIEKCIVRKGDVLFNRTNSKELVGKTCVFDLDEPMVIAGYIIRVRINEKALPEYLSAVLNSKYGKDVLYAMCKAIVGQANINAQELQDIKLFIPPIELQKQYVEFINQVDKLKFEMEKSLKKLANNFNSLMQSAFKGELFN